MMVQYARLGAAGTNNFSPFSIRYCCTSPCDVATTMRQNLNSNDPAARIQKVIGNLLLLISTFVTLFALMANFAAWMMVQSTSKENARAIISSSLGLLFATYLPG
jgi:hypothetical protein